MANADLMRAYAAPFDYPRATFHDELARLAALSPSPEVAAFRAALEGRSLAELEELHYRTFEGAPACVPYLSVHLFGEESYKRAELMTGLAAAFVRVGHGWLPELPDHLAVVLRGGPALEEWPELVRDCLLPAVRAMADAATRADNPFASLLAALFDALAAEAGLSPPEAVQLTAKARAKASPDSRCSPACSAETSCG